MAPKKAGEKAAGEPALKKAKVGGPVAAVWEWQDGDDWKAFGAEDTAMLEGRYKIGGGKSKFNTTEFSFNKGYGTIYEVNFEKMTQKNADTKKFRNMRRKDPLGGSKALWEWWNDQEDWSAFNAEDSQMLEKAFASGMTPLETKQLSFNEGYDSLYIFDFDVMAQVNSDSGTSRKIQRTAAGGSKMFGHSKGEDDAYADVLLAAKDSDAHAGAAPGMKFKLGLDPVEVSAQKAKGAVSCRKRERDYGPIVSKDPHGRMCFDEGERRCVLQKKKTRLRPDREQGPPRQNVLDEMLKNEKEFCGEWAVFYHSYSAAALLYEVQAAVGSVLFRFKAEFAGLPRILAHGFKHIPTAARMLEEFPKWKDQDHNPAFKAVGLCATSSLLAPDSEAPATGVFLAGYSVGSLAGVLQKLLGAVGVPKAKIEQLAIDIIELSAKHGLDTCGIPGGKKCKSGRSGHMLQIFLRRELCDQFVYPAFPFGAPDKNRDLPLSKYLTEKEPVEGQVRITLNPDVFLRASYARMFTYSADPTYYKNRPEFIKEMIGLLDPILGDADVRVEAARGIFGGEPPEWWTPEDQSEMAAMPAARFAASDMAE
eukprot:CAMPEP_0183493172 /NCGR_PEP_ID=MMETSP0370-20130417/183312_1 /TAXON_ID=268820 /ORGANISM="Peridinium aciculiferum, Strain PAER-2" /LENGTH=591 /DNA_ID=CAMNT_0025686513 /DNA_START=3 /DNA_END=1779 /DNA_ORIENTATION=-